MFQAMTLLRTFMVLLALALPVAAHAASDALAEVDGVAITAEEIEKALGAQLSKLQEQIYTLKHQKVEALIAERLLAKEAANRGISESRPAPSSPAAPPPWPGAAR